MCGSLFYTLPRYARKRDCPVMQTFTIPDSLISHVTLYKRRIGYTSLSTVTVSLQYLQLAVCSDRDKNCMHSRANRRANLWLYDLYPKSVVDGFRLESNGSTRRL